MPAGSGHSYIRYYWAPLRMTLIHNGRAPAKVQIRDWSGPNPRKPAAAPALRLRPVRPLCYAAFKGMWKGCRRPIGNLRHLSVMLDLAAFTRRGNGKPDRLSGRSCARVAERQTRWLQVPVSERAWGFKSPLAHANGKGPNHTIGALTYLTPGWVWKRQGLVRRSGPRGPGSANRLRTRRSWLRPPDWTGAPTP